MKTLPLKNRQTNVARTVLSLLLISATFVACGGTAAENSGQSTPNTSGSNDNTPVNDSEPVSGAAGQTILNQWNETATWTKFNSTLALGWQNPGGDWIDADGEAQGNNPFSTTDLVDDNQPGAISIDVTEVIQATDKADFLLRRSGGASFTFHSREAPSNGPTLLINGETVLQPTADTNLNSSTSRALGQNEAMTTQGTILIRFELPEELTVDQAELRLYSTGAEFGNQTLQVFASSSAISTVTRPSWLNVDETIVASFEGADVFNENLPITLENGIAHATLTSPKLTWINANKVIPNQTSACATVYQRLGLDFKPGDGGKHPGFSNTGDSLPGSDVVNGITYPDSGWGGRSPDGIHWSARTGYGSWTDTHVAAHTYFYAMSPHNRYGWVDPIGYPFPKGEWSAYVQCLQLNTINGATANNDGKLYYEISGIGPVYSREDIRWRDIEAPESQIREFWINYYCGGTQCGTIANRGTVSFAKAVITKGLPDMQAVAAEVARLNRDHP